MPRKEPVALDKLVRKYMEQSPYRKELKRGMILALWPKIVGESVSSQCRDLKFKGSKLTVCVSNPGWRQELHLQRYQIMKKLNTELKEEIVTEIIVKA